MSTEPSPSDSAIALPPRWYMVNNYGAATLCVDQADAESNVREADEQFPRFAPHVAVQLAPVREIDTDHIGDANKMVDV